MTTTLEVLHEIKEGITSNELATAEDVLHWIDNWERKEEKSPSESLGQGATATERGLIPLEKGVTVDLRGAEDSFNAE